MSIPSTRRPRACRWGNLTATWGRVAFQPQACAPGVLGRPEGGDLARLVKPGVEGTSGSRVSLFSVKSANP